MYDRDVFGRIIFFTVLLLLVFCGVGAKLTYLHLFDHSKVTGRTYKRELQGVRGSIYDRNGDTHAMAISLTARQYFFDYKAVSKKHKLEEIAQYAAPWLEMDSAELLKQFKRTDSRYIKLGVFEGEKVYVALTTNIISGIGNEEVTVRRYLQKRRMSHVIGLVNKMNNGVAGVEQQYNEHLVGISGLIESETDATRTELVDRRKRYAQAIDGSNIYLTLDHNVQFEVERALAEVVEKFDAFSGWAIVQMVKSGEILAMASYPDFEPENFRESSMDLTRNNALAIVYEPGSIMKAVTVAAVLNERLVTPDSIFDVGEGCWFYAGKPLRDHVKGRVTVSTALKKSSNIACARMGLMLGHKRFEGYLRAFNFGAPLGIDLPGEERGILARGKDWERDKLKLTRAPIGQGVAVTGLQMISAFSTLANDGVMMQPHVVKRVVTNCGKEVYRAQPKVLGRPIRPAVARAVREMLVGVTEDGGTGKRATVPGYSVAGKTGTAQKAVAGGYSSTDYYASFVGFVPASNPVFSVLVTVERPQPQHTGGFVAAPVFARIAAATARYLELEPDLPLGMEDEM